MDPLIVTCVFQLSPSFRSLPRDGGRMQNPFCTDVFRFILFALGSGHILRNC